MIIDARNTETAYWRDLWQYRDLLRQFAGKEILLRYRQTLIGVGWAVARPIFPLIVLVVFGRLARVPSDGIPYPVFVLAALIPYQFVTSVAAASASSLVGNSHLISKVYFPRLLIPLSTICVAIIDLAFSMALLFGIFAWYGCDWTANLLFLPAFMFLGVILSTGLGLLVSSISVRHRDVIHALPYFIQFGLYLSPVLYATQIAGDHKPLLALNPMTGIIDGCRWSLFGTTPYWPAVIYTIAFSILSLAIGVWAFRRQERTLADVI
jgi:lipopolysaccharide transport system permease protein